MFKNTIAKRLNLTKCIEIVGSVVDYKIDMATYNDYVKAAKLLNLHRFSIPEISNEVSPTLTDFAARIFCAQYTLFTKESYDILATIENEGTVKKTATQRRCEVSLRNTNGKPPNYANAMSTALSAFWH